MFSNSAIMTIWRLYRAESRYNRDREGQELGCDHIETMCLQKLQSFNIGNNVQIADLSLQRLFVTKLQLKYALMIIFSHGWIYSEAAVTMSLLNVSASAMVPHCLFSFCCSCRDF